MSSSRYLFGERLGEGASAEVFEGYLVAEDGFRRRVAIKRAKGRGWSEVERARFVDEARIASALHHAHVAAVLDYGFAEEGAPFLVLELVEGLDLSTLRRAAGNMSEAAALVVGVALAHALAYVHAASDHLGRPLGIVHRDLSPGNVLISWSGDVKLSDFGVARGAPRGAATQIGVIKGTPGFMAPEQMTGGHVDARADVFGLGALLLWMLTGASPTERDEDRRRLLAGGAPKLPEGTAEDLRRVLLRALAPQRHQRHGTAEELAAELGQVMLRRLDRDPRSALLAWLARHPLGPTRLGQAAVRLPLLVTGADEGGSASTTIKVEPRPTPRVGPDEEDPTLLAGQVSGPPHRRRPPG